MKKIKTIDHLYDKDNIVYKDGKAVCFKFCESCCLYYSCYGCIEKNASPSTCIKYLMDSRCHNNDGHCVNCKYVSKCLRDIVNWTNYVHSPIYKYIIGPIRCSKFGCKIKSKLNAIIYKICRKKVDEKVK